MGWCGRWERYGPAKAGDKEVIDLRHNIRLQCSVSCEGDGYVEDRRGRVSDENME